MTALAFCQFSGILNANGLGTPVYEAAVAPVIGGDSLTIFDDFYFESVGRCICTGVTSYTCSNPAGSFFVPDLELRGKSEKTLYEGGSPWKTLRFSPDFTSTLTTLLLSTLNGWRLIARLGSNNSIFIHSLTTLYQIFRRK